jgi:hypothetical protein
MLRLREALYRDFNADEFWKLSPEERAQICIRFAERSQALAMIAPSVEKQILMTIASQWLHLMDVIKANKGGPRLN